MKMAWIEMTDGRRFTGEVPEDYDQGDVIMLCFDPPEWNDVARVLFLI